MIEGCGPDNQVAQGLGLLLQQVVGQQQTLAWSCWAR
jgi:hypothetical protein